MRFGLDVILHVRKFGEPNPHILQHLITKENIYTIDATKRNAVKVPAGDKDGRSDTERVLQADLRGFMNEFSLDDEDLELEKFACAAEPFCKYELETAASFCTFPYAKKRLEEEMDPQLLDRLRKKGRVELDQLQSCTSPTKMTNIWLKFQKPSGPYSTQTTTLYFWSLTCIP